MATNKVLFSIGTPIIFAPSGGTAVLTLTSLANGAGRISAQYDRTVSSKPGLFTIKVKTKAAAALAIGSDKTFEIYLLQNSVSADVAGNLGTADAAIASADKRRNLSGPVVVLTPDSTTNGEPQISSSNIVEIYDRYIQIFCWNAFGQALSATAGDHSVVITPYIPDIQAAA